MIIGDAAAQPASLGARIGARLAYAGVMTVVAGLAVAGIMLEKTVLAWIAYGLMFAVTVAQFFLIFATSTTVSATLL